MSLSVLKKSLSLVLFSSCFILNAAEDKPQPDFATTEIQPGLYMLSGVGGFTGGNIGLSVGEDGVFMIDDSMPPLLDKMKAAIKSVTSEPVDFLVNTHVHGDHTGNNEALATDGTHVVAHQNLRHHMLTKGINNAPASKGMLPVITFSHSMSFHLNGQDAHLIHMAKAHTDGDAVIHFEQANVIHTGDIFFNGLFPFIDLNSGGSPKGYLKAQQEIFNMANDATKIIPGHGPLASKSDLKNAIDMLSDAIKLIENEMRAGKNEDEIVKINPLAKYHEQWNWGFITTEKMTRQLIKGLQ